MKEKTTSFLWWFASRSRITKALLVVVLLVGGWFLISRIAGSGQSTPIYQTERVEKGTIVSSVSASGSVLTVNAMSVNTTATGMVETVFVKDGSKISSGQKIATIRLDQIGQQKNATAWSSYLSAKNSVDSASVALYTLQSDMFTKWDTFRLLAQSGEYANTDGSPRYDRRTLPEFHIAEKNWLAAEAKYKNQQAVISQTRAAQNAAWLSYQESSPVISAPATGIISNITIVGGMVLSGESGTSSQTGTRIAVIQTEGKPLVRANLSEIDILRVKTGQKATIEVDALPDKTFTGSVASVDRIGSVSSGVTNYPVVITLDTDHPDILSNMAVTATIILDTKTDILVVPSVAVVTQNDQSFVRVLKNGKVELVPVETGIISDSETEIISGISEGDSVVTGSRTQSSSSQPSVFGGGFGGGGAFRSGGFGGGQRR